MDEIGSPKWKAETFDQHGINYPRTEKGNPSFKGGKTGWMATHPHWLPQLIAKATKYNIAASKFLEGHILDHPSTAASMPTSIRTAPMTAAALARCAFPIPTRRCSKCRRATRNWRR